MREWLRRGSVSIVSYQKHAQNGTKMDLNGLIKCLSWSTMTAFCPIKCAHILVPNYASIFYIVKNLRVTFGNQKW